MLDVVFLGTPDFAVPTLDAIVASSHRVTGVVTQPDRRRGRGQRSAPPPVRVAAEHHGIDVLQTADVNAAEPLAWVAERAPAVGVVVAFGQFLKKPIRELPRFGLINLHASLLPRYRGAAPIHAAVIAGDAETGVCVMQVERRMDAGAVFATATTPIARDETTGDVELRLAAIGAPLVVDVLDRLATGTATSVAQDEAAATHVGRLGIDDRTIAWDAPARAIHDRVRGLTPHPGALAAFAPADGAAPFRVRPIETGWRDAVLDAAPGAVLGVRGDGLEVATGDGVLTIARLTPAGGKPVTGREFAQGRGGGGGRFVAPPDA